MATFEKLTSQHSLPIPKGLLHMLYYHMLRAHLAEICIDRALRFFVFFTTLLVFIPLLSAGAATTSLLSAPSPVRTPALFILCLFSYSLYSFAASSLILCTIELIEIYEFEQMLEDANSEIL